MPRRKVMVTLDPALHDAAKDAASRHGWDFSGVVEEMLRLYLALMEREDHADKL